MSPLTFSCRLGPGEYVPDVTEGIRDPRQLPPPQVLPVARVFQRLACPRCGQSAPHLRTVQRHLHDLGDPLSGLPRQLLLSYSQHHCRHCGLYFHADTLDLAPPYAHYTHRVIRTAVRLVVEDGLPYRPAVWHLWRDHRVFVPLGTIQNWIEAAGEKGTPGLFPGPLPGRGPGAFQRPHCHRRAV